MTVIPIGQEVMILGGLRAHVTAVMIEVGGVSYKCCWLNGTAVEEKWIVANLVVPVEPLTKEIGFHVLRMHAEFRRSLELATEK